MCGIVAISAMKSTDKLFDLFEALMIESQIRGKHATGIAWAEGGKINTLIKAVPSKEFFEELDIEIDGKGLNIIGHCRYSTSDLEYNQPIAIGEWAIAHNGVVTQKPREQWEKEYGLSCEGGNDSELLLRCMIAGISPRKNFKNLSMATALLGANGELRFGRNEKRPLWYCVYDGGYVVASTKDIFMRAFKRLDVDAPEINNCGVGTQFRIDNGLIYAKSNESNADLQVSLPGTEYYLINKRSDEGL